MAKKNALAAVTVYEVTAVTYDGSERIVREIAAASEAAAQERVVREGLIPVKVKLVRGGAGNQDLTELLPFLKRAPKVATLSAFAQSMWSMLVGGLSVPGALEVSAQSQVGPMKEVVEDVREQVIAGRTLSEALAQYPLYFDDVFVGYIRVGEQSGALPEAFGRLAKQLSRQHEIKSRIKGVTAYPKVMGVLLFVIVIGMLKFLVPTFEKMFTEAGAPLPAPTAFLVKASHQIMPMATAVTESGSFAYLNLLSPFLIIGFLVALRIKFKSTQRNVVYKFDTASYDPQGEYVKVGISFVVLVAAIVIGQVVAPMFMNGFLPDWMDLKPFGWMLKSPLSWIAALLPIYLGFQFMDKLANAAPVLVWLNKVRYKTPAFGKLWEGLALSRWTSTLAGSLASGIQSSQAVLLSGATTGSIWHNYASYHIAEGIISGHDLSAGLNDFANLYPIDVRSLILAGEETGDIAKMAESASTAVDHTIDSLLTGLGAKIETLLIVVMGIVVGGIVISLYMPIFGLAGAMSNGAST